VRASIEFLKMPKDFWANVRTISQKVGYTKRGMNKVLIPTIQQIRFAYEQLNLSTSKIENEGSLTKFGNDLLSYFEYRANILNDYVEPRLMDSDRARQEFLRLKSEFEPSCPLPMNKQKGDKKEPEFLTGIINMIVEKYSKGTNCDFDPRELTTVTNNGYPLRTLARRIDGAFPSSVNPIAIWEIKEYYYTTTFGSRVADGVYESLLDGMELEELLEHENRKVLHYLMVDAYYTWWNCGKSYLCRLIDMLNMGYVDEILFGYEVIERLPSIVDFWLSCSCRPAATETVPRPEKFPRLV